MKIKTVELEGPALDWAVAKCDGYGAHTSNLPLYIEQQSYTPSTDWARGGPIIEREKIDITYCNPAAGWAATGYRNAKFGLTPLIAAMRSYVASKLGDEVEIPEDY